MKRIFSLLVVVSTLFCSLAALAEPTVQDGIQAFSEGRADEGCKILLSYPETERPDAQYALGMCSEAAANAGFAEGKEMAAKYFERSARQNFIPAQVFLGVAYMLGEGVAGDNKKALAWFHKAADQFSIQRLDKNQAATANLARMLHGQLLRLGENMYGDPKNNIQYFLLRQDPTPPTCKLSGGDGVSNCQERWDMYRQISSHITQDVRNYRKFEGDFYNKWVRDEDKS